jgi:hypothetical protein
LLGDPTAEHRSAARNVNPMGRSKNMLEMTEWIERQAAIDMTRAASEQGNLTLIFEVIGGGVALRSPGIDSFMFNRVLGLGSGAPLGREALARVVEAYRAASISRFFVHLYDDPRPPELPAWLEELGVVRYRRSWDQLGRGRDERLPEVVTPFCIRPAVSADADAIVELFAEAFDLPPPGAGVYSALLERPGWHTIVATDRDAVVAAGLLFIDAGVAYLAGGATRPSSRGRGAQLGVMVERCRMALDAGCRWIASETGAPAAGDPQHSHQNMRRCGLRVLGTRHNYAPRGSLWRHGQTA